MREQFHQNYMSCCRDIKTLMFREVNGGNRRKNMNVKQMSKHIQNRKIDFCIFIPPFPPNIWKQLKPHIQNESHNWLLGKIAFLQEMESLGNKKKNKNIQHTEAEKLPHVRWCKYHFRVNDSFTYNCRDAHLTLPQTKSRLSWCSSASTPNILQVEHTCHTEVNQ